jgi:hypothetical protein
MHANYCITSGSTSGSPDFHQISPIEMYAEYFERPKKCTHYYRRGFGSILIFLCEACLAVCKLWVGGILLHTFCSFCDSAPKSLLPTLEMHHSSASDMQGFYIWMTCVRSSWAGQDSRGLRYHRIMLSTSFSTGNFQLPQRSVRVRLCYPSMVLSHILT